MKATEIKLVDFLKKSPQFVIPVYQRVYSWSEKECRQLWNDIVSAGNDDTTSAHFIGSIVYVEKGLYSVASQSPLLVIDGQQRLTTVTLLIEALARALGDNELLEGFSGKKLRDYFLIDPREEGERKYKLLLSQTDKDTLVALLEQADYPKDYSLRVKSNFEFFCEKIDKDSDLLLALCKGLAKLIIVDISLNRDQDNPQLIFESLNSTGKELSQADLIRNYILMGLEPTLQTRLYDHYWRPMEKEFGQENYAEYFDSFMRHYLTVKTGAIPKEREVYDAFKVYAQSPAVTSIEHLVADIYIYAGHYCAMAFNLEVDQDLRTAFRDLQELKVDVAFPFLLELYNDYRSGLLSKEDLLQIIRTIESYVFRRAICGIPTNSMNKTFGSFTRNLKKDHYLESVQAAFLLLPSYRRFPNDEEFKRELIIKDLYNFRSRTYWLRRLENYGRKERVPVDEYTIEHVMPQNENLSADWREALGPEWERVQQTYLHTIGNLTLTGYNSEYSDRPFEEKRNMKGGFAESPLRLNKEIANKDHWNEAAILSRAEALSSTALQVWTMPVVDHAVLQTYKPEKADSEYSISDHTHLCNEPMSTVFSELRKQILALDPCVTETFLKLYVAYKAETNFADIIPQAKRLIISLNMPFSDVNDPKQLCKDVSTLGRWGNGDVQISLSTLDDVPYAMGLIRQSFDRQMEQPAE